MSYLFTNFPIDKTHFQVFIIKYKAAKSIFESFHTASHQIWKCGFESDFGMFDLISLLHHITET